MLEIVDSANPSGGPASQAVTRNVNPSYTAVYLSQLFATAPQNLTVQQVKDLIAAANTMPGGSNPAATLGSLFQ